MARLRLLLAMLAAVFGGVAAPAVVHGDAYRYDAPTVARVGNHAAAVVEVASAQIGSALDESAAGSPSVSGASTTPHSRSVATNSGDPNGIEDLTGYPPDELAALIARHVEAGRLGNDIDAVVCDLESTLRDASAPVKPGETGPMIRNVRHNITIFVNRFVPLRSSAVVETAARWGLR